MLMDFFKKLLGKKKEKHTYKFNPHTLSYEKVVVGIRDSLKKVSFTVAFGVVLAVVINILALRLFDSPQERRLKREITQYERQMKQLNGRVARAEKVLTDIEQRDDNVYRTIFEAEPIDDNVRHSGIGGVDRYEELEGYDNTELVKNTSQRVDDLTKRLYIESRSLDEVYNMAVNKQKHFDAMPAILPVVKGQCRIASGFGSRYHPILHSRRRHTGVDLSAKKGTPVYATADGTVTSTGRTKGFSGYGILVEINHGYGFQTLYAHL
ncbi:MAG: M23 family metallopeptidase, partial [Bacteroidales bacterium]|nr:M23 family metallopeptidase [Bacteroidales bacterium]